jgi:glycolate oxidase FAD binding subunit
MAPASVLRPRTTEELATELSRLDAERQAVIPWSGGTRMHVGNVPHAYDAAINLTSLPVSIEHVAGDMVCIVSANATVATVQRELHKSGQRLPFDVPNASVATIGGSLASSTAGRMRSSFGGARDWVIGLKVMTPDGVVTKSGGRVVKNVQGFDLHRLHTGAFGTLGIIVEAGFKLIPTAPSEMTVAAWFEDLPLARQYAMTIFNGPFTPEALALATGAHAAGLVETLAGEAGQARAPDLVLMKAAGVNGAVERMTSESTGLAGTCGATGYRVLEAAPAVGAWDAISQPMAPGGLTIRASLTPTAAFDLISQVERMATRREGLRQSALLDVGFGAVQFGFEAGDAATLTSCINTVGDAVRGLAGTYVVEQAPSSVKAGIDVFGTFGANMELMKRLKQEFDPNHTLNRGRFAGGI